MDQRAEISDFLRSRRARVNPRDAGIDDDGRVRRVPGLRRDEVARLANMSVEYYTRLEQGRAGNPSPEVLEALATALRLDPSERAHLVDLAGRRTPRRRGPLAAQRVRPGLLLTLQSLESVPAFIIGRRMDVLASNRLAKAVIADFDAMPAKRRNMARWYLLDPEARERVVDWETAARDTVAVLRFDAGRHPDDRQLADLVGELTLGCPEFSGWWNDHQVLRRTHGTKTYRHPVAGEIEFAYESFEPPDDPDQGLCVYNVQPDSPSAEALRLLDAWTAPAAPRH
ncbi:helix-turn-helix transcriptional regulator [Glycomyces albidus]|jgi:transcriptional regulator with XRE-family HTH domain|uniref:Helix-turn-helix domain-containing protein n=1 Tax=Glycomyces albidus TaxID=2656774 RepID=A0A6L5G8J7_9ACTN|nr:helix-turn-helix transcriptional regulator [Glycomyces albidus]MQM25984.1 helix-turn-helix domain-containing protein [Glycomyces albidus]